MDIRDVKYPFNVVHTLQWGHAFSGMDIMPMGQAFHWDLWLQWGHAFSGMDMCFLRVKYANSSMRFNGAMPFQAWI